MEKERREARTKVADIHVNLDDYQPFDKKANQALGRRISKRMNELGLNVEDLRDIIEYSSESQPYRIMNGDCGFNISKLYVLTQALDVSSDYLLFGREEGGCR